MPDFEDPEIYRSVLDSLQIGICMVGRDQKIVFWNRAAEKITGYHHHDVVGHRSGENILAGCNDIGCVLCGEACPLQEVIHEGKSIEAHIYIRHKAGHRVAVRLDVAPIRDRHGSVAGVTGSFEEEPLTSEVDLHQNNLAAHGCLDLLTGIPNHAFTQSHLREHLAFFEEHQLSFGILYIQVEELEHMKATHGHQAVDVMLHVVAQTIKHTLLPDGFLGRWTDDRFLAIVPYCDSSELQRAAESVRKMVGLSGVQWWDDLLSLTVSVQGTMVQPGDTAESILKRTQPSSQNSPKTAAVGASTESSKPKSED